MPKKGKKNTPSEISIPMAATPELVGKMVEIQLKELEARNEETKLEFKKLENNKEISEMVFATKLEDNKNERSSMERVLSKFLWAVVVVVLIFAGLAGVALFYDKEAVVMKIFETFAIAITSFAGGWGAKAASSKSLGIEKKD